MVKKSADRFWGKGKTNKRRKSMERAKIDLEAQVERVQKMAKAYVRSKDKRRKKKETEKRAKVDFEANAKSIKGKENSERRSEEKIGRRL